MDGRKALVCGEHHHAGGGQRPPCGGAGQWRTRLAAVARKGGGPVGVPGVRGAALVCGGGIPARFPGGPPASRALPRGPSAAVPTPFRRRLPPPPFLRAAFLPASPPTPPPRWVALRARGVWPSRHGPWPRGFADPAAAPPALWASSPGAPPTRPPPGGACFPGVCGGRRCGVGGGRGSAAAAALARGCVGPELSARLCVAFCPLEGQEREKGQLFFFFFF